MLVLVVQALIDAGYDKEATNNFGATPLHRAAANFGNDQIVKVSRRPKMMVV